MSQICGAKARTTGKPCQTKVEAGRCRLHGGASLKGVHSPTFKDGRRSKHFYLPPKFTARIEQLTFDIVGNLEESIKAEMALETEYYEKLNTSESPEAWEAMLKTIDLVGDKESDISASIALHRIRAIAEGAIDQFSLHARIQSVHETQRRLSESVSKIRKEIQETYTEEQFNALLNVILNSVMNRIADPNVLGNIADDIDAHRSTRRETRLLNP